MTPPMLPLVSTSAKAKERSGSAGPSKCFTRALATQSEIDRLRDYLVSAEAVNGPVTDELRARVYADIAAGDA